MSELDLSNKLYEFVKDQKDVSFADDFIKKIKDVAYSVPFFIQHVFDFTEVIDNFNKGPSHELASAYYNRLVICLNDISNFSQDIKDDIQKSLESLSIKN